MHLPLWSANVSLDSLVEVRRVWGSGMDAGCHQWLEDRTRRLLTRWRTDATANVTRIKLHLMHRQGSFARPKQAKLHAVSLASDLAADGGRAVARAPTRISASDQRPTL